MFYYRLEKLLKAVLSTLKGTQLWEQVPRVAALFETVMGPVVHNLQAENGETPPH